MKVIFEATDTPQHIFNRDPLQLSFPDHAGHPPNMCAAVAPAKGGNGGRGGGVTMQVAELSCQWMPRVRE